MCAKMGAQTQESSKDSKKNRPRFELYKEDRSELVKDMGNSGGKSSLTQDIIQLSLQSCFQTLASDPRTLKACFQTCAHGLQADPRKRFHWKGANEKTEEALIYFNGTVFILRSIYLAS